MPDESEHPKILIRYVKKLSRDLDLNTEVIKSLPGANVLI